MPTTDSNLPTKIEVRPDGVGIHSSWAMSTSMKSPSENSRPERGMKSTLAVASALRAMAASSRRLTSLTMKLGAPVESMLSNRFTPGKFPRLTGSPRRVDGGRQQVAQENPGVLVRVLRERAVRSDVLYHADAVALGTKKPRST